jgi:hypothetical protein
LQKINYSIYFVIFSFFFCRTLSTSCHTYKLSPILIKGREPNYSNYLDNLALIGRVLYVYIPKSGSFLKASFIQLCFALFYMLDLLLGWRSLECCELDKKINGERCKFLVAELQIMGKVSKNWLSLKK